MLFSTFVELIFIQIVYFDNAATTRMCSEAVLAATDAMEHHFGNPSSLHRLGFDAENQVTKARKTLAAALGCDARELTFTSGATESNNLALQGGIWANKRSGNKIVMTAIEHPSVSETVSAFEKQGFSVTRIFPRADGSFAPSDFVDAVDAQTVLVSCMYVNNETGILLPVEEIAVQIKQKNPKVLFHVDAVQSFCKIPFSVTKFPVDLLSVSAHKLYGPKGVGALFVKKGTKMQPISFGGGQEKGLRPGTENVALIASFGAAVERFYGCLPDNLLLYRQLNKRMQERLKPMKPVSWNTPLTSVPYIINISVAKVRSEIMLHFLEQEGIYVSSGSACSKGARSGVLGAMGLPASRADSALRVSFSHSSTIEEVDRFADVLQQGIERFGKLQ